VEVHFDYSHYNAGKAVITTGVFDGVHKGHVALFDRLNDVAQSIQGESVVVTFWPHPQLVLKQNSNTKLLNTLEEKLMLLRKSHIQHVVVIPFTAEFSALSSEEFISNILVDKLKVCYLLMGYNHHFGKDRRGNFELTQKLANQLKFKVEKVDAKIIDNENVSATLIRNTIIKGDMEAATRFLGYDYMISGTVMDGDKLGRTIGYPTANLKIDHDFKLVPKQGVYAVEVEISGTRYAGMLNIGYRPTIEANPLQLYIEVHIINFIENIYGKRITLYFKQRIRNEIKFNSLNNLKQQLDEDKLKVIKILGA